MIELLVEPYCHDCTNFEADVHKIAAKLVDGDIVYADTVISCKYKSRCKRMLKYLEKKASEQSAN